jgi:gamma-glutamyltranspeptidase/glutathione hydrolase
MERRMRDFSLPGRSPALGTKGMAATAVPAATLAALDVLREGGNALDAAVAAVAVLGVIEPMSTGIGGDCFCLYAPAGQRGVIAMNGSGRAPAAAKIDWYEQHGIAALEPTSAHSVTVPGAISAWETLLAAHGRRGLDAALQPAIRFAEAGFRVTARVARDWADLADKLRLTGAERFLPGGKAPVMGDLFRQPELAQTLRAIAKHGSRAFYEGPVAADMVATLRMRGGLHTEEDFANGRTAAHFVDPIRLGFRGYDVWQCPPNGQGIIVLMLLGMLGGYDPADDGPLGLTRFHRHLEAARLAYRDRDAFLGDPSQAEVPVGRLLSDSYLGELRRLIRDDRVMPHMPAPGEAALPAHQDTTYLCVVDGEGNACSFINSLFNGFGSAILAERSGVMLQNRGFGFRVERGHPNCIGPNKRPMHTIIPGMVTTKDGEAVMPYGVMGGHFQPMGQTLFLTNLLDYGVDVQESLDAPRAMAMKGKVEAERGIPAALREGLTRLGHEVVPVDKPHGGGQAIWIDRERGVLIGGSDPRKDGMALGLD